MTPLATLLRQTEALDGLLGRVEALSLSRRDPVVVFDLDDTLLSTAQRHIRILREYAAEPSTRARHLEEAWKLVQIERSQLRYLITETAQEAGVWDPQVVLELKDYWFERFFKNEYIAGDDPLPGAAQYCQDVLARGAAVVYMTGRDEAMREGTISALTRHGFPLPGRDGVVLILKPAFHTPDLEFKTQSLRRLAEMGAVTGGFENEPAHVNLLQDFFPGSRMVFVDSRHSGKPVAPHPAIPWIKDFLRD